AAGERGPLVVELFARLDDPARAQAWAERVLASSPHHPRHLLAAGIAAAAAGAVARADIFFVRAAAASGDAGAVTLEAARALVALGHPLAAASAARRAAQLTAPGEEERDEALALAALALDSLGRHGDALALRQHLPPVLAGAPP